jgi:hypothetical protein
MTTSQDIIDRATGILRVRDSGNTYLQEDANKNAELFISLQNLISEWVEDAVVNIPAPVLVSDPLDIPPGTARAFAFNLAVEVESDFGQNLSQTVYRIAELTKDRLEAEIPLDLSVDMSDLAFTFNYDIESDR